MSYLTKLFSLVILCGSFLGAHAVNAAHHGDAAKKMPLPTIVEVASGNPDFSTLVAALKAGGLVEALSGEGPFTVFAPTNEAFAKLPEGTLDKLLLPENKEQLVSILTYHVVPGKVMAADVVKVTEAKSLQGEMIAVEASDSGVKVDGANVVATDIKASNGVIHVVDAVMMPGS